jgi:CD109 antigen
MIIHLLIFSPKIGSEVSVEVLATEQLTSLTYQILGRSNIIESKTLQTSNTKSFNFKFIPTALMAPKASLVVFYVRPDGEIISDRLEVKFGFELQNFVDLKLSSEEAKPGEMLNITVSANQNSFVGLLGVDQSVLLLKSGNDIEKSTVSEDIEKYSYTDHYNSYYSQDFYSMRYSDFESSNLVVITNAKKEFGKLKFELIELIH